MDAPEVVRSRREVQPQHARGTGPELRSLCSCNLLPNREREGPAVATEEELDVVERLSIGIEDPDLQTTGGGLQRDVEDLLISL